MHICRSEHPTPPNLLAGAEFVHMRMVLGMTSLAAVDFQRRLIAP